MDYFPCECVRCKVRVTGKFKDLYCTIHVSDLHIGSIGLASLGPQNLGDIRLRCKIILTLSYDYIRDYNLQWVMTGY